MRHISIIFGGYLENLHIPSVTLTDVVEIFIIAFLVYGVLVWVKETHAWTLLKGVLVIAAFLLVAAMLNMTTILWIASKLVSLAVIAIIVVLQPELRKALENLGQKNIFLALFPFDTLKKIDERFSDKTVNEIVKASVEMGKARTGALIVIEHNQLLSEYERTGIDIDAIVTSQLLINIFEHNTPLHDGAVIVRGDRVASATCYLPLSDSRELSKELGTRHRAGLGIAEVSDSVTVIVSEETGKISAAHGGKLYRNISAEELRNHLTSIQDKVIEDKKRIFWKGRSKNEAK
jgi:diadenylate cyclase